MSNSDDSFDLRPGIPASFWVFLVITIIVLIVAIASADYGAFVTVVGGIAATLLRWPWNWRGSNYELTDAGLKKPGEGILKWDDLENVTLAGQCVDPDFVGIKSRGNVVACFKSEKFVLKNLGGISPNQLYRRLWDIVLADQSDLVRNETILKLRDEQTNQYGEENVLASVGGPTKSVRKSNIKIVPRMLVGLSLFFFAALAGSIIFQSPIAIFTASLSFIFLLILSIASLTGRIKKVGSELLMSPAGLTLISPKLKGTMKWSEVKSIDLIPKPHKPIQLKFAVDGAEIYFDDSFQYPLWYLCRRAKELQRIADQIKSPGVSVAEVADNSPIETGNPYQTPR
jgi:hypothetical protein